MFKHNVVIPAICVFVATSCSEQPKELQSKPSVAPEIAKKTTLSKVTPQVVFINSLDELYALFKLHNYTREDWKAGHKAIPRILFSRVNEKWQHSSSSLPVNTKKEVFFRLMAPLVFMANEEVMAVRHSVEQQTIEQAELRKLLIRYRVTGNDYTGAITTEHKKALLNKLDIVPPSLALAQAAEESGWATSRFTLEGNAFFGQWDYSGNGMVPKSQRKELGNYGIARFDTPLDSVKGYLFNINRGHAYEKFREVRAQLREKNSPLTGLELVKTLDKYSERGQAYIDSISSMIRYNKLMFIDEAYLSDQDPILIKSKVE